MRDYITRKHHNKKIAEKTAEIAELRSKVEDLTYERDRAKSVADDYYQKNEEIEKRRMADIGQKAQQNHVMETTVRRAHREISSVRPNEGNSAILIRVIGNTQGLLSAAIDSQHSDGDFHVEPFDPYPEETEEKNRKRDEAFNARY